MIIYPKKGIDQLVFGMKQPDVVKIYGNPDKQFKDEDHNIVFLYFKQKMRLTFYEDEDFRLGYIISSHKELELFGQHICRATIGSVEELLHAKNIKALEVESFDSVDNYFNESNWMIFQVEFGEVIRFELGAVFNEKEDAFDWKFKA